MPRSWDDPWRSYPASKPIKVDHGIASRKQRGDMAATWWSKRFVTVLEGFGLGARMQRGRRYARAGQVVSVEVSAGLIAAQVQGSRPTPYLVLIRSAPPTPMQWRKVDDAFRSRVGLVAQLLAGEVPPELEEVFGAARVDLFPSRWGDVDARCNCPDWENPCKHLAAALYVFADQLDDDPWLLLAWRGRSRDDLLDTLRLTSSTAGEPDDDVAPWWPLRPGAGVDLGRPAGASSGVAPDPPDRVLLRLGPLDVTAFSGSAVEALGPAYTAMVLGGDDDPGVHGDAVSS